MLPGTASRVSGNCKWLVLLDIDGTLCTRIRGSKQKEKKPPWAPDYSSRGVRAWFRPFTREFIATLIDNDFKVGTWTSSSEKHGDPLLQRLLGQELYEKLSIKVRKIILFPFCSYMYL